MSDMAHRVLTRFVLAHKSKVIDKLIEQAQRIPPSAEVSREELDEFMQELERTDFDDDAPRGKMQGESNSFQRILSVTPGTSAAGLLWRWQSDRKRDREKREEAELLRTTYEVAYWKGTKFGKPERMPREDLEKPWKPGHQIADEHGHIEGRNFDSDLGTSFSLRSKAIGTETAIGTVKSKRTVRTEQGLVVQYLIKPRSSSAQKEYDRQLRIDALRAQLRNPDYLGDEKSIQAIHQELAKLKASP